MSAQMVGGATVETAPGALDALALSTARLRLLPAHPEQALGWLDYYLRNRERFAATDPAHPPDFHTLAFMESALSRMAAGMMVGEQASFALALHDAPERVIGTCRFTQIVRGAFHSCMLGYGIDGEHEGRGLMTEAVRAGIDYMFEVQRLHRIQANHLPENLRSARVLERLGFAREGYAPCYLHIAGAWRDHVLNALINPHFDDAWMG